MTETDWLVCTDLCRMLEFIQTRASDERKLRLFGCACCRRAERFLTDPRHRQFLETAELHADGLVSEAELAEARKGVLALWGKFRSYQEVNWGAREFMRSAIHHLGMAGEAFSVASFAARGLATQAGADKSPEWEAACAAEDAVHCNLLRDIFGNPTRPFQFDSAWRSGPGRHIVSQAREIYESRCFERLPDLADSLERANCHDPEVLQHCRQPTAHVRGCWVVDALLGQETAVRTGLTTEAAWQACKETEPLLHFLRNQGSKRRWRLFAVACCERIDHLILDPRSRRAIAVAARFADEEATEAELETARAEAQLAQEEAALIEYQAEADARFCLTPEYEDTCCRLHAAQAALSAVGKSPRQSDAAPGTHEAEYWRPTEERAAFAMGSSKFVSYGCQPDDACWYAARKADEAASSDERQVQCYIIRDLFGEFLGPPGVQGAWLPYGSPSFSALPEYWCLLPTRRQVTLDHAWLHWRDTTIRRLAQQMYDSRDFSSMPILADALEEAGCTSADILDHCRGLGPHVRGCWVVDLILGKE